MTEKLFTQGLNKNYNNIARKYLNDNNANFDTFYNGKFFLKPNKRNRYTYTRITLTPFT